MSLQTYIAMYAEWLQNYTQQEVMENFVFPNENMTIEEFDENE